MADRDKDLFERGSENRVEGAADELSGKVRGAMGDLTDNESEQVKGKAQELKGKMKQSLGETQQDIDRADGEV